MATKIVDDHIFDSFLKEPDIYKWAEMNPSFPDIMREELHFEMDCCKSYEKLFPHRPFDLPQLEQYKVILKNLATVDTEVYGNFVLSEWRFLTHWSGGFDPEPAAYFFQHALPGLVEKINSYPLVLIESDPYPVKDSIHQEEQSPSGAKYPENDRMSFSEVYKRGEEVEREGFIHWDKERIDLILSKLS